MTQRRLWNIARFAGSCGAELVVDAVFVVDADDTARRTNLTPKCRATGGSTMGRSRRFSITTRAIPKERGVHSAVAAGGAVAAFGVRRLQAPLSRVARVAFDRLGHRFPTFDSFVIPLGEVVLHSLDDVDGRLSRIDVTPNAFRNEARLQPFV
ncbi:MAG: hypothetical protein RLY70_553 [Planctomycetota bacterium]